MACGIANLACFIRGPPFVRPARTLHRSPHGDLMRTLRDDCCWADQMGSYGEI